MQQRSLGYRYIFAAKYQFVGSCDAQGLTHHHPFIMRSWLDTMDSSTWSWSLNWSHMEFKDIFFAQISPDCLVRYKHGHCKGLGSCYFKLRLYTWPVDIARFDNLLPYQVPSPLRQCPKCRQLSCVLTACTVTIKSMFLSKVCSTADHWHNRVGLEAADYQLNRPELVKVAGVAPTELQELGGGSQSQPTTLPLSCSISCANSSCVFPEAFLAFNFYVSFIFIHILSIQFIS